MYIRFNRTDLTKNNNAHIIKFNSIDNELKITFKNELIKYLKRINNLKSILIVGLGNDSFTADSVGPKVVKGINVNAHLIDLGLKTKNIKVSALEPGVLGQTGIDTERIIKSVCKEVKPDALIVIDSFITDKLKYNEKTIQITDNGIIPGSGIMGINSIINKRTIGCPVIVIGVPTALETTINNQKLIVSTNSVDKYVIEISKLIAEVINEVLYFS